MTNVSRAPFALSAGGLSAGMRDVTRADEMLCDPSISINIHPDPSIKELPDPANFPPLADGLTKYWGRIRAGDNHGTLVSADRGDP